MVVEGDWSERWSVGLPGCCECGLTAAPSPCGMRPWSMDSASLAERVVGGHPRPCAGRFSEAEDGPGSPRWPAWRRRQRRRWFSLAWARQCGGRPFLNWRLEIDHGRVTTGLVSPTIGVAPRVDACHAVVRRDAGPLQMRCCWCLSSKLRIQSALIHLFHREASCPGLRFFPSAEGPCWGLCCAGGWGCD